MANFVPVNTTIFAEDITQKTPSDQGVDYKVPSKA